MNALKGRKTNYNISDLQAPISRRALGFKEREIYGTGITSCGSQSSLLPCPKT